MAHFTAPDGSTYVDTDFINDSKRVPRVSLEHMGFGEFYANTPKGRAEFDRMRGKPFTGMKGRSHKLYGEGADWLVQQMEMGGFSERTAATSIQDAQLPDETLRLASTFDPETPEHKALLAALTAAGHVPKPRLPGSPSPMREPLVRLAASYPTGSTERREVLALLKSAGSVSVGDLFYSSWGYDQTNIDFYEVVAATTSTVQIRPVGKRVVQQGRGSEEVVALPGKFTGPPKRKKIKLYGDRPFIDLNSYSSAYLWDGKPKSQTAAGWGH